MKKGTLTIKQLEEIYSSAKDLETTDTTFFVSSKVGIIFKRWWNSLPWYTKLIVKIRNFMQL